MAGGAVLGAMSANGEDVDLLSSVAAILGILLEPILAESTLQ